MNSSLKVICPLDGLAGALVAEKWQVRVRCIQVTEFEKEKVTVSVMVPRLDRCPRRGVRADTARGGAMRHA